MPLSREQRREYDKRYQRRQPFVRVHKATREQLRELSNRTGYPMTELLRVAVQRLQSEGFDETGMLFTDEYQDAYHESRQSNGKPVIVMP